MSSEMKLVHILNGKEKKSSSKRIANAKKESNCQRDAKRVRTENEDKSDDLSNYWFYPSISKW